MTSFGLDDDLVARIASVFAAEPKVKKVSMYGSRAVGNFKPHSDVDIAVFAPELSFDEFLSLRARLDDLPCVFTLDTTHFDALGNEALKTSILRDGIPWPGFKPRTNQV